MKNAPRSCERNCVKKPEKKPVLHFRSSYVIYFILYNNQINARAMIGQSAMVYCASKLMEISRVF